MWLFATAGIGTGGRGQNPAMCCDSLSLHLELMFSTSGSDTFRAQQHESGLDDFYNDVGHVLTFPKPIP